MDAICVALSQGDDALLNPKTERPYSKQTIKTDIDAIKNEWRSEYVQDMETHASRQLAEIGSIKMQAFAQKNPDLALKAISLEMKLLGTAANPDININFNIELVQQVIMALTQANKNPEIIFQRMLDQLEAPDGTE